MYKKPKDLIPKDSMVTLLTDMYIASSANNIKNKFLKKEKNYVFLVYDKYQIDSARFSVSNIYYTSRTEEYTLILKDVKSNLDSLKNSYIKKEIPEEISEGMLKERSKDTLLKKSLNKKLSLELMKKNEKLSIEKDKH